LLATKKTPTNEEDDDALLSTVTAKNLLNQLRADSEYDEDDEITSRPTPTGSPPPVTAAIAANPTGMNKSYLII